MEALGIVDGVDEDANGTSRVLDVLEAAAVDFFGLEGLHELSALRISALSLRDPGCCAEVVPVSETGGYSSPAFLAS